jgi:diguanylate cyclase (GGDEF)-like protein
LDSSSPAPGSFRGWVDPDSSAGTVPVAGFASGGAPRSADESARADNYWLVDPLTGAANRTHLMDRLIDAVGRAAGEGRYVAVMYVDLDRFKMVNDSLGHQVGDAVLIAVASRLIARVRPSDTVARLGGDEFVILAEGLPGEQDGREMAKRLLDVGRQPFRVDGRDFLCTLSVGLAGTSDGSRRAVELIGEADTALYRAKERGRDRVEVYDDELRTWSDSRRAEEAALRRVLDEGEVRVQFEPVVDIRSRRVVAAQVVPYVRHRGRDVALSVELLDEAERWGLLSGVDEAVVRDGVVGAAAWSELIPPPELPEVVVHLTARHLAAANFQDSVSEQLGTSGLPPGRLLLALTERTLAEAAEPAVLALAVLRGKGVRIGIDGFGTGLSSVTNLGQFPIDFVMIDPCLVRGIDGNDRARAVVSAVIALAHAYGLNVVAHGVETPEQLRTLHSLDCDRAQGPLMSSTVRGAAAPPPES